MAYANLKELLSATCDAIRLKEGSKGLINHQDIPNRIEGLNNLETSSLSDIHIWEKSTATEEFTVNEIEETDVTLSDFSNISMDEWDTVSYADEIAIIEGKIILVNPTSITLSSPADRAALKGKYLYTTRSERYYRIPTDATLTYSQSTYSAKISASVAMRLTVTTTEVDGGELIGYVVSSDKADYPENGNVGDGYKYVYIGTAESNEGLDTSDATAVADDILKGKTAYANGRKITGTHECAGDTSETVEQATPTIEVSNSGLITATAEQIAGYVKAGTKSATKQLTTQAAKTYIPGTSDQTIASGKYLTGVQTIEGDSNLVASNIKSGVSIFGVAGSYAGENTEGIDTSDATATAADIVEGATAYVNGEKVTGEIPVKNSLLIASLSSKALFVESSSGNYISCKGKESGKKILDNANVTVNVDGGKFGDATAADVVAGKTFTSANGLNLTGTHECPDNTPNLQDKTITENGTYTADSGYDGLGSVTVNVASGNSGEGATQGGYVFKTGTVTNENVIETGLSYIKQICLYRKTFTSKGLLCYMYNDELGGIYTYCTSYSSYAKSAGHGQTTDDYRDGGTFTYGMTGDGNKMANGVEYTWIAIGEE